MATKTKKQKALETLINTKRLSTGMLADLGLSFEQFLQLSQLSEAQWDKAIERLKVAVANKSI